jgi:hypothetical protein
MSIQLLSPSQAAFQLRQSGIDIASRTVQEWCKRKKIPSATKVGGRWYMKPEEVFRILRGQSCDVS